MEISKINQKLDDLNKEKKKINQYTRDLEIMQTYTGEDRVVLAEDLYKEVLEENKNRTIIKTGKLPEFDRIIGGFVEGQIVIVSAPTGQGKTTFCQTLTMNFANQDIKTLFLSYEVGVIEFLEKFPEIPGFYMPRQTKQNSIDWLEQRVKEGIAKYNCKVLFIDHLHYLLEMQKMAQAKSISLLIGMMMRELKRIAIENGIVIFLVSHMRKSLYKSEEDLPDINDLRDSSFVGQESDIILFLFRKQGKDVKGNKIYTNETLLKIAKNRRTGNLGCIKLTFNNKEFSETELYQDDIETSTEDGNPGLNF